MRVAPTPCADECRVERISVSEPNSRRWIKFVVVVVGPAGDVVEGATVSSLTVDDEPPN